LILTLEFIAPIVDAVFLVGIDVTPQRVVFLPARGQRGGAEQD
jgi:hypothetical protein